MTSKRMANAVNEVERMTKTKLREWERQLAELNPEESAVLYRRKDTGVVDWTPLYVWQRGGPDKEMREMLLRTTTAEAVRLKWLSH